MKTIQIKIVKPMRRYPISGAIITTEVDDSGVIIDSFLRRRVMDSEIDGCVVVIDKKKAVKSAKETTPVMEETDNG